MRRPRIFLNSFRSGIYFVRNMLSIIALLYRGFRMIMKMTKTE
jgi:hypothetical protein